jgi:L-lactate dehydrogenase complex protein LldG
MVGQARKGEILMSDARQEILGRIHRSSSEVSRNRAEHYEKIARSYTQAGALDVESKLALFEHRLRDYDAVVHRCSRTTLRETIAEALKQRGKRQILVPDGIDPECLPMDSVEFVRDHRLRHQELDRCPGVLTTCAAAIAISGTIVLRHSPNEGRRALTLVPDYHLCIVHANQVVETVPEGIRALGSPLDPITTISGPSATADIEMTRIKGVHGPRTLDVILVVD